MPIGDVTIYECDACGTRTDAPTGWQIIHRADGSMRVTCEGQSCNDARLARAMRVELARRAYAEARATYHGLLVADGEIGLGDLLPEERLALSEPEPFDEEPDVSADGTT
jgi:hypothetical protein